MDPISDMFIRIKNAYSAGHETVQIPYSKFKHEILKVMERSGFVANTERKGKKVRKTLEVTLKYNGEQAAMNNVKLISKPSRRLYASNKEIARVGGRGTLLLSTPQGVLTGKEAQKKKVGGEMIAEIL